MENIPPMQDALLRHCKRVSYKAEIWINRDIALQQSP